MNLTLADIAIAVGIVWVVCGTIFMVALGLRAKLSAGEEAQPKDACACGPEAAPADSDFATVTEGGGNLQRSKLRGYDSDLAELLPEPAPSDLSRSETLSTRPAPFTQPASPAANASPGYVFPEDKAARVENFASGKAAQAGPADCESMRQIRQRNHAVEKRVAAPLAFPSRWGSAEKGRLAELGLQIRRMAP